MKKIWTNISTYALVALVSIGATYGMYTFLDNRSGGAYQTDSYTYGQNFDQKNVHLASITAEGYPDFTKAAENSIHAVVHIKSTIKAQTQPQGQQGQRRMVDPFEYFFGGGDQYQYGTPQPRVGFGSGVIISNDGYIITNNHVIDKATDIEVTLNDNSKYNARLIGTDPNTDIALLKVEGKDFSYIPFGNSDDLKVGEWVLAVGNPFNLTSTVTAGIVSAKGRGGIGGRGNSLAIESFIQTDAAINQGNSGGALVNTNGQLIGINTAIYSQTGDFAGYGFAVPISIASKVVADMKEFGTVQRAVLGVEIADIAAAKEIDPEKAKNITVKEGVYVGGFAEQSSAKQAGLEIGDVIVSVDDATVRTANDLQEKIARHRPGQKVKLGVKRGNTDKSITVTLKNMSGNESIIKKEDGIAIIGAAFKELSAEKKKEYGINYGIEVGGVDSKGAFSKEGIAKGFIIQKINDKVVNTPDAAEAVIQVAANSQDKVLFITGFYPTTGQRKYYLVELASK